jgi:hypothetical protein
MTRCPFACMHARTNTSHTRTQARRKHMHHARGKSTKKTRSNGCMSRCARLRPWPAAGRALVRMLSVSAAADARAPLRPCAAPRRNVDASGTPRPARVATSCDVARAAMPINPLRRRERKDVCTDRFRFEEPGSSNTQIRARIWTKLKDRIGSDRNGTEPGRRRDEQPCRAVRALVDGAVHFSPFTGWQ